MELDLADVITDEELEYLQCPTMAQQQTHWNEIINSIDDEKLKNLTESIGCRFISSQLIKNNNEFRNNPYYLINCVEKKLNNSEKQFILKLTDPHPFFKRKKTTNEISILNYLQQNTKIPVPIVLSYSKNKQTSLLGCEYILLSRVKGKCLCEEFKSANEIPEKIIHQMLDIFKQLKEIKFKDNKIGCFDESMSVATSVCNHAPVEASSETFLEYLDLNLAWVVKEMFKIRKFKQIATDLEVFRILLKQICNENESLNNLNFDDEMSLVHSDLNGYNILINPITFEITAITDWQSSYYGYDHKELGFFQDWFDEYHLTNFFNDKKEKYQIKKRIAKKVPNWYTAPKGFEIRKILNDFISFSIKLVFYCSISFKDKEYGLGDHLDHWYYELGRKMKLLPFILIKLKEHNNEKELQLITDKELKSLDNPTFQEQEDRLQNMIQSLNDTKFKLLVDSIGFKFISSEPFKDNMGMVNTMFTINVKDENETKQLILRITDVHPFFTKRKTTNEVAILQYLKLNTKIPVPQILSFSNDKDKSLIGCEYILMNKINGKILGELIDEQFQDVNQLPDKIINQMIDIFKQFKQIKLNDSNRIGCFDLEMNIKSIVQFGINIGPCDTYLDLINEQLEWCCKEMNKIKIFKKISNDLELFRQSLVKICNENKDLDNLNFNDEMNVYHGDLHAGNIFIDPETYEITGIIDWEWAAQGFDDMQIDWISTWYDNSESKAILQNRVLSKVTDWYQEPIGKQFRNYLKEFINFKFLTFYMSSILKHSNCEPTDWSFYFYSEMIGYLKTFPDFLAQLKDFKKTKDK